MADATAKVIYIAPVAGTSDYSATLQVSYNGMLVNATVVVPGASMETAGTLQTWMSEWLVGYKDTLPKPDPYASMYAGVSVSV